MKTLSSFGATLGATLATALAATSLAAAVAGVAVAANGVTRTGTPVKASNVAPARIAAGGVQPFLSGGRGQRPPLRRNEQGPSCTVVNVSQVLGSSLYGSPPYSAAVAVTTNGATVSAANVNASGCDFGIYVAPGVSGVTISNNLVHDAFQAGIMVDSASNVNVEANQVSQTGWHDQNGYDPNGVQTGLAIYYLGASGDIGNNFVTQYEKNGITANLGSVVSLENNVAIGQGSPSNPTEYIAQNGFQIYESELVGASTNFSAYNWYGPASYAATGYLLCGATNPQGKIINKSMFYGAGPTANKSQDNNINIYAAKNC